LDVTGSAHLRTYRTSDESRARAIYEESFPPSLRAPWRDLVDHRPDEDLLVLVDDADEPVGITLTRRLGETGMTFVRYLAIDPARRGGGLGHRLVEQLREAVRAAGATVLLLDVEEPIGDHAEDDRRRIAFYERCGLTLLDAPGYAPPDHGTQGTAVPLLLMGEVLDGGEPLTGDRLDEAVRAVLLHRYGVQT
jgi:GNAT superfamily N-acetyltransferase